MFHSQKTLANRTSSVRLFPKTNPVVAVAALLLLPTTVIAAPIHHPSWASTLAPSVQCVSAAQALRNLKARYGETVHWIGRDALGTEDVLTMAPNGKTWTLLAIGNAHGTAVACMLDAGGARKGAAGA